MLNRVITLACAISMSTGWSDTIVSEVVVNQRWPWSEKVDVDFILTGDTADVDITATWDTLRGDAAPGVASPVLLGTVFVAIPGAHRFTWDPSASPWSGQTLTGFTVTLTPRTASEHAYLVVDLEKGGVSYLADVPAGGWSDDYKTKKMVFRRIPAGTYQLGMESNLLARVNNGPVLYTQAEAYKRHDITFTSDFYVGVFKLTYAQSSQLTGDAPGAYPLRPRRLSYDEIRGPLKDGINWPKTGYAVSTNSLLAKLRAKAGPVNFDIDLCQESQWEVAMRAGTTTFWPNGGTVDDSFATLTNLVAEIGWRGEYKHDVGLKTANQWGVYDPVGMMPDWSLCAVANFLGTGTVPKKGLKNAEDPVGASVDAPTRRVIRGSGDSTLLSTLPCVRQVIPHETDGSAGARFCIHLKPLAVP